LFLTILKIDVAPFELPIRKLETLMIIRKSVVALLVAAVTLHGGLAYSAPVSISSNDIGGVVTGDKGPEAGVWVIAETKDLPTKFAKIVVTDDKGQFVIPELPNANYQIWVRRYVLVDSPKVESKPGKLLKLKAVTAPSEKAAAEYYPGVYWYSMLEMPGKGDFPGTGDKGNGIAPTMKTQNAWVDTVKNACQSCHALGSKGMREVPETFKKLGDSFTAWAHRTQAGQAMP